MKKYFLIVLSLLLSCQNIPSNNKIENEKQEKVRLNFLNKQDFSKMLIETKGLEKINKSKSLEIMNKYKNIGSNKIIINENVKPFLDKNVFNIKDEDSGECFYNSYCYDECLQIEPDYGGAGSGCLISIGHGCLVCPEPSGGSGGNGGDNNNNTKDCSKVITPEELNNLISILGNSIGFNIKADMESSLISDLKEFTKIINPINKYENQIQEIIKTYNVDNDTKVKKLQDKINELSASRYNIAGIITPKLDSLKYQSINLIREANVLSDSAIGVDLTSTSSNPLGVYKDQIEILDSEFDYYVSNKNTYDLIQASKILAKEILLNNEIITKYLNQGLKDLSLEENINDDDIETPLDKLTKVSQVVLYFSRQVDNHRIKVNKEYQNIQVKYNKVVDNAQKELDKAKKQLEEINQRLGISNSFSIKGLPEVLGAVIETFLGNEYQKTKDEINKRKETDVANLIKIQEGINDIKNQINEVKNDPNLTQAEKNSKLNELKTSQKNLLKVESNTRDDINKLNLDSKELDNINKRLDDKKKDLNNISKPSSCNFTPGKPHSKSPLETLILTTGRQVSGDFPRRANPNEILYRADINGKITFYATYDSNGGPVKRVDLIGPAHDGVPTPHVQEFKKNVDSVTGDVFYNKTGRVRSALPSEIP